MHEILWPSLNAALNAASALGLTAGYLCIRKRKIQAHKFCMLSAFLASTLFLISYLLYHLQVGSTPFPGRGPVRLLYFSILISHILLAVVIVPLATRVLYLAYKGIFDRHAFWARITLPLWLYVSVTGVTVYWMLYQITW